MRTDRLDVENKTNSSEYICIYYVFVKYVHSTATRMQI